MCRRQKATTAKPIHPAWRGGENHFRGGPNGAESYWVALSFLGFAQYSSARVWNERFITFFMNVCDVLKEQVKRLSMFFQEKRGKTLKFDIDREYICRGNVIKVIGK
jgi:hypothetical protein